MSTNDSSVHRKGGRYSKVSRRVWNDEKFRALSAPKPNAQTLWFRILTGPELTNVPGLFSAWPAGMAQALGWPAEAFSKAFEEVSAKGMAKADWTAGVAWVPNAIEYNRPESPNVVRSWRTAWEEIPECQLKAQAYERLRAFLEGMGEAFAKAFDEACGKPSAKAMANQDQEQKQKQKQESFALARVEGAGAMPSKPSRKPKHAPDEIAAKARVVDTFIECFKAKKGVEPKLSHDGEHAAAFKLVETYGVDEGCAIVRSAFEREFVVRDNATLRYIASKPDTFRGSAPGPTRAIRSLVQPAPVGQSAWEAS